MAQTVEFQSHGGVASGYLGGHKAWPRRLAVLLALVTASATTASVLRQTEPSPGAGSNALIGRVERAILQKADWFEAPYSRYQPAGPELESLRTRLAGVSVEVYFGSWCGDSKRQVPRLLRLLDLAGFDERRLALIALSDRPGEFKQAPGRPEAKRYVHRTPTIVLARDGAEIGRIVETPYKTLEADLLSILDGRGGEPRYGAEAWVHRLFVDLPSAEVEKALASSGPEVAKRGSPDSLSHYAEHDLLKNGRAREAKAVLDLHLKLDPGSAIGQILLAEALVALGRKAEALEALELALVLEPGNDRARKEAEKLRIAPI